MFCPTRSAAVHLAVATVALTAFFAPPARAATQASGGLNGTYTGTYRCGQAVTKMKLAVTTTAAGELTGHVSIDVPTGTTTQTYTYGVFGQFNPTTAKFVLSPGQWEGARPANAAMVGFNGTWDSTELTGAVTAANCGAFQLDREQANAAGRSSAAAAPATTPPAARQAPAKAPAPALAPGGVSGRPASAQAASNPPAADPMAAFEQARKALAKADQEVAEADKAFANPVLRWSLVTKTDKLTDEVSTRLAATTGLLDGDYIEANALCNDNGIAVFFYLGSLEHPKGPDFLWNQNQVRGDPSMDVRLRVDTRPAHVAQGYPDKKGAALYSNSLGLLFYEPNLVSRTANDQRRAARIGIPSVDSFFGGLIGEAAQTNAETEADNSAGPMSDLIDAKSVRVELPVAGYADAPILDLNPQNPAFHTFAAECGSRFGLGPRPAAAPARAAPPSKAPASRIAK